MRAAAGISLVIALTFLNSCNPANNPAMTGTWLFALTPTGSASVVLQATANLTQVGNRITGQVSLSGNAATCGSEASMSGTVKGNSLTLQLSQLQSAIDFTGTANLAFTSASGTYTATAGSCLLNGGTGSWSAALE
jgi:hypothetical protein